MLLQYKLLPEMCNSKRIKLIIIDSLAGLVRFEYNLLDEKDIRERTQYLFALASQLKWLSETYKIAIVVVNQVSCLDLFQSVMMISYLSFTGYSRF